MENQVDLSTLTEEEVRHFLGTGQEEVKQLVKRGKLTAYKLGGSYVRYRKEEVLAIKNGRKFVAPEEIGRSSWDKFRDFWNFYSFYILTSILVVILAYLLFQF